MALYVPDLKDIKLPASERDIQKESFTAALDNAGYKNVGCANFGGITQEQAKDAEYWWANPRGNYHVMVNPKLMIYYTIDSSD